MGTRVSADQGVCCSCGVSYYLPTLLSLKVLLVPVSQASAFGEAVSIPYFLWGWVIAVGLYLIIPVHPELSLAPLCGWG